MSLSRSLRTSRETCCSAHRSCQANLDRIGRAGDRGGGEGTRSPALTERGSGRCSFSGGRWRECPVGCCMGKRSGVGATIRAEQAWFSVDRDLLDARAGVGAARERGPSTACPHRFRLSSLLVTRIRRARSRSIPYAFRICERKIVYANRIATREGMSKLHRVAGPTPSRRTSAVLRYPSGASTSDASALQAHAERNPARSASKTPKRRGRSSATAGHSAPG